MKLLSAVLFFLTAKLVCGDLYIDKPEDFITFATNVNKGINNYYGESVYITSDLDFEGLDFQPVGLYNDDAGLECTFQGDFDGGGHLVQNVLFQGDSFWSVGFIGVAYGKTTIQNVIVDKNCVFNNSYNGEFSSTSSVVSYAICDDPFMHIKGCVNLGTIIYQGPDQSPILGNVAGYIEDGVKVEDCVGAGVMTSSSDGFFGGVVGYSVGSSDLGYAWINSCFYDVVSFRGTMCGLKGATKLVGSYSYDDAQRLYDPEGRRTTKTLLGELRETSSTLPPIILTLDTTGGAEMKPLYAPVVKRLPTPARVGHSFVGWFAGPDGSTPFEIPGDTMIRANVTAYAGWSANTYYVHFQMGSDRNIEPIGFVYDTQVALPIPSGNREFKQWCLDPVCNNHVQAHEFRMPAYNITVYPLWGPAELDGGLIALIIILAVLFVGAVATVVGIYARVAYVKKHSVPPGMTVLPDGTITLDSGYFLASKVDLSKSTLVKSREKFPIEMDTNALTFGLRHGEFAPLDTPLQMKLTLRNKSQEKRAWEILPESLDKYTLLFNPSSGVLSHNDSVKVTAQITMNCTTLVNSTVPIVTWPSNRNKTGTNSSSNSSSRSSTDSQQQQQQQEQQSAKSHYMLRLKIESEHSVRLDPDDIKLIQPAVGEGSFGTVFKGFYKSQTVAVKVIKNQASPERMEELYDAADIMKNFHSSFLVSLVGVVTFPGKMSLVTEFVPYGTYASIQKRTDITEIFRTRVAYDASKGLRFLHNAGLVHTCLSTGVIYVQSMDIHSSVCCKLGNLRFVRSSAAEEDGEDGNGGNNDDVHEGSSKSHRGSSSGGGGGANVIHSDCSTPSPMSTAPEMLRNRKCTFKTDVFSLGTVFYEIFTGKMPTSKGEVAISADNVKIPNTVPRGIARIIKSCWDKKPSYRPGKSLPIFFLGEKFYFCIFIFSYF